MENFNISENSENLEILKALNLINNIKKQVNDNKNYGENLNIRDFVLRMQLLNPQQYGFRFQNRIANKLNLKKVNANLDSGDLIDFYGDFCEVKCSIIDDSNTTLNCVKIRDWQQVYYFCVAFDVRKNMNYPQDFYIHFYKLNKSEMLRELEIMGGGLANGQIKNNINNTNVEKVLRLEIKEENEHFKRWNQFYKSNAFKLL